MKKKSARITTAVLLLSALLSFLPASASAGLVPETEYAAAPAYDGFLFQVTERRDAQLMSSLADETAEHVFGRVYWSRDSESVEEMAGRGWIEYIEPNYYATLFDDDAGGCGWPYDLMSYSYPASYSLDGAGVRIAVIDSGVDRNNPDLQSANICEGFDYTDNGAAMSDSVYHGTKVIQMIAGDNNSLGLTGMAAAAEIVPLKCFSSSSGATVKVLAQAIMDAVDKYDCDIINMSWGLGTRSSTLYSAVQYAFEQGVILVAAAGNVTASYPQGTKIYPAYHDEVISVSAIGAACEILSSSQMNDGVNVCAPGGAIPFVEADGSIAADSGTSFAAPCITAAAALLRQLLPAADGNIVSEAFRQRAADLGDDGFDSAYGYGMIRMDELLGAKWSYYDLTEIDGVNYPRLLGWMLNPEGGRVFAAAYDRAGKMTDIQLAAEGSGAFSFDKVIAAEADEVLVAYLNEDASVCCPADRYR